MIKQPLHNLSNEFERDHAVFWNNLSRLNNLLVIMNISMFFLTGLINKGYYYTFFSLTCLCIVAVGTLIPTGLIRSLRYYLIYLVLELSGLYFLINSIVYWVRHSQ